MPVSSAICTPVSLREGAAHLRYGSSVPLEALPKKFFLKPRCSIGYLLIASRDSSANSAVGPDSLNVSQPRRGGVLSGELSAEEFSQCDAQWSRLNHRMTVHYPEEISRRLEIARSSLQDA